MTKPSKLRVACTAALVYGAPVAMLCAWMGWHPFHADPVQQLTKIRGADMVCTSNTDECKTWASMMLSCETGAAPTCAQAERYRELVSGVELSTAPNAFNF